MGGYLRVCSEPGCSTLVTTGYCTDHERKPWAGSNRSGKRIMGRRGQRIRQKVLRRDPWCAWPECTELATEADHIVPLEEGGDPGPENMQGLCHFHHAKKTREEKGHLNYWDKVLRREIS